MTPDLAIVGAGPAGAAAAIVAARAGLHTVVVDRARFPRDKCCGDGLTVGALRLLEQLGLDPGAVPSWTPANEAIVSSPSRRPVRFPLPTGRGQFAAIARREELDAALVDVARGAGATVLDGVGVVGVAQDADAVSLTLADDTTMRARYSIAADGMWSPVRKLLGVDPPDYRGEWHAIRQYFRGVSARAERELMVWFEPDFLPGYVWSFPLGAGRANVGFGIRRGGSYDVGAMKHLWPDILARPHIGAFLGSDAEPESPHKAWPIPARIDRMVLSEGRVFFVGDAVAATDPMTGEGIGQALTTGMWAADAVIRTGNGAPVEARTAYETQVRRELVPDHRMANVLVRALSHRTGARMAVRLASLTPWTGRNFARWLFEDYPRAVLFTPGRWRPGLFTDSGAFAGGSNARNVAATSGP